MKKTVKIISVLLIAIMLVASLSSIAYASTTGDTLNKMLNAQKNGSANGTNEITTLGGRVVGIVQVVGVIIAAIILLVIGIKYMLGSAEEKAEYKKTLMPYVIGAALVFAASAISGIIFGFTQGLG